MVVDCISDLAAFDALEARWNELYALDEHRNVFLSWAWLRACIATDTDAWMVLGVREPGAPYLAFLPLGYGRFPAIGPTLDRELYLAGIPRADYTGMLALPGEEGRAIPALARYIEDLAWDNFTLNDWADERIEALIAEFSPERYRAERSEPTPCRYAALPETWEAYLHGLKHGDTRVKMRQKMRKVEALPGYRFERATRDNAREAIERLLQLNGARWHKNLAKRRRVFGGLFERCFEAGCFIVLTLYDADKVMAAQGSFVDPITKTMLGYMIGFNPEYAKLSPGFVLVCLSIRAAIEDGYRVYDFTRGNEPYKLTFSSDVRYTHHTTLTRRGLRAAAVNAGRSGFFAAKGIARTLLGRSA